jgi:carbonic anhydrase/acetyltransferase-like protein (isoleucine patch superfamily)
MGGIIPFGNKQPKIHKYSYISQFALLVGAVTVEEGVSVWPYAIVRADEEPITLHMDSAVLEHALVEAPEGHPMEIGEKALVSHGAILHGCTVENRSLIGIGAIVLDGSHIGSECIIGAGSVVPPFTNVPRRTLMLGVPAKLIREVRDDEIETVMKQLEKIKNKADVLRTVT